jgi:hypothetical protein
MSSGCEVPVVWANSGAPVSSRTEAASGRENFIFIEDFSWENCGTDMPL